MDMEGLVDIKSLALKRMLNGDIGLVLSENGRLTRQRSQYM